VVRRRRRLVPLPRRSHRANAKVNIAFAEAADRTMAR